MRYLDFTKTDFQALIEQGFNMVPVYRVVEVIAPCPISIYELFKEINPILLHSSRVNETDGRYSVIALDSKHIFRVKDGIFDIDGKSLKGDPIIALRALLAKYRGYRCEDAPLFSGGAVGYFAYECCHYFEKIHNNPVDDLKLPDIYLKICTSAIIVDHIDNKLICMAVGDDFELAQSTLDRLQNTLQANRASVHAMDKNRKLQEKRERRGGRTDFISNFNSDGYVKSVAKVKDYIVAGDTFQVNLSQRLELNSSERGIEIYRRLVDINPVHFSAYFDVDDVAVICGSPERLCKVVGRKIEARPIAGTRRRGTPEEDQQFIEELMTNEKEIAEHSMLVDLDRNDLGRVCEYGTVEVGSLMEIVHYSHVMHIESTVHGSLRDDVTPVDVLAAKFPGGTITGAPKVRTMEIISELEPNKRGIYTGSIGYFSFTGELDLNIVIRTIVKKGDKAFVQVGAGIVHDSIPDREYKETLNKAKAQLEAL